MKNKYLLLFFSLFFIFTFSPNVLAIASISGIPNFNLDFNDEDNFWIDDYATGHVNSSNLINFINPDTNAGVTLWGDVGGQHTNSYFSISLDTTGHVEMISYEKNMNARPIQVCVGSVPYITEDCDTFNLEIKDSIDPPSQWASFSTYNLSEIYLIKLNLNNFFSPFEKFTINYTDNILSQTILMTSQPGQGQTSTIGGVITTLDWSTGTPYLTLIHNNNNFDKWFTINVSNNYGSAKANFRVISHQTGGANLLPNNTAIPNFIIPISKSFKITDLTKYGRNITDIALSVSNNGFTYLDWIQDICGTIPPFFYVDSDLATRLETIGSNIIEFELNTSTPKTFNINYQYRATANSCGYTGASANANGIRNFTITFTDKATSTTWFENFKDYFINFFPDSEDLNIKEKWTYAGFSIILLNLFIFVITTITTQGRLNFKFSIFLGLFLSSILLFWFIAIGYISISVLVMLVLVIVMFIYIKGRGS